MDTKSILGIFIFLSLLLTSCGQATQKTENEDTAVKHENWETYETPNYKIQYPKDVTLDKSGQLGMSFSLFFPLTSSEDTFQDNINLTEQNLKGTKVTLDMFVKISEQQIANMFSGSSIIESKRGTLNNLEYQKLIYSGVMGQYNLKFEQYYILKNDRAYVLTLTTEESTFGDYQEIGEKIMNSFVLK